MIDLDAMQSRLDRGVESLTDTYDLLREVERLRGEAERERAAVVAYMRDEAKHYSLYIDQRRCELRADAIERGEHRREGGKP